MPHADLLREIGQLARQFDSIPGVKEWCQDHDLLEQTADLFFEPRAGHELCANVLRGATPALQAFAERVVETELRVLLAHALQNAGYDCDLSMVLRKDDDDIVNEDTMKEASA